MRLNSWSCGWNKFPRCKLLLPLLSVLLSLKEVTGGARTWDEGACYALLMSGRTYTTYLGSYMGDWPVLPYLFLCLIAFLISARIHWYTLYISDSPVACHLFCCSNCSSFGHWTHSVDSCPSGMLIILFSEHFLTFWRCGIQAHCVFSAFASGQPFSLYWRSVFVKTKIWVLDVSLLLGCHCLKSKPNLEIYTHPYIYIY